MEAGGVVVQVIIAAVAGAFGGGVTYVIARFIDPAFRRGWLVDVITLAPSIIERLSTMISLVQSYHEMMLRSKK